MSFHNFNLAASEDYKKNTTNAGLNESVTGNYNEKGCGSAFFAVAIGLGITLVIVIVVVIILFYYGIFSGINGNKEKSTKQQ